MCGGKAGMESGVLVRGESGETKRRRSGRRLKSRRKWETDY